MINKPLPKRTNYVVSSTLKYKHDDVVVVESIKSALKACKELSVPRVFNIGGQSIYKEAIAYVDTMFLTHVHLKIEDGDTFFPNFDESEWNITHQEVKRDENSGTKFHFSMYERKGV